MQLVVPILTILFSGLVSAVVTHRLATSHQERQFRREKLEQLYTAMDSFCTTLVGANMVWPPVMREEMEYNEALDLQIKNLSDKDKGQLHRSIEMLVNIYFPSLLVSLENVFKVREEVNAIQHLFKKDYKRDGPVAANRKYVAPFLAALSEFDSARERFNKALFAAAKAIG
jgi:hypothetical protein